MRLLVYEFITGGGLIGAPLPPTLLREGRMMRDALLADLTSVTEINVTLTRDPRCPWPVTDFLINRVEPHDHETAIAYFERALLEVDMVWPIAPESDGALARLAGLARAAGKKVLLSDAMTLAICTSKYQTARVLGDAGIAVVPTYHSLTEAKKQKGKWVSKPDDGSGGEGIRLWPSMDAAGRACIAEKQCPCVFQPWCSGESLSLSLLCASGAAVLLAVNRHDVAWKSDGLTLAALTVNAYSRDANDFQMLAQRIALALPGLWGYIGVDLIRSEDGTLTVLEVNPRLTTSYCGLRAALGINVVQALLSQRRDGVLPVLKFASDRAVDLDLADHA
jgi:tyramine---L-glutamate ligase